MDNYNLKTERLTLRLLEKGDVNNLWPYVSDPAISKDMSWEAHVDLSETEMFIDETLNRISAGKAFTWCIFMNEEFIGLFSLIAILRKHRTLIYDRAEIAYWLAPQFQGKGIMTEAGLQVLEFAFKKLNLHKVTVGHHLTNKNSEALIRRLGFTYLYTEEEVFKKNGEWITCKFYELNSKNYF